MAKLHLPFGRIREVILKAADGEGLFDRPATDAVIEGQACLLNVFAKFVPDDAATRLAGAGIFLTVGDVVVLFAGIALFEGADIADATPAALARERRIAELAGELADALQEAGDGAGWRHVWGEPDPLDEEPDPVQSVEIAGFLDDLDAVARSAAERVATIGNGLESALQPNGNRTDRVRFHFWRLLTAFWAGRLGRQIATSVADERGPGGPLIAFIQAFSAGGMKAEELSGEAVRQWVRRHGKTALELTGLFPRHPAVARALTLRGMVVRPEK